MREIVILYLLATGEPEAVFLGETALLACLESAVTYEAPVSCEAPTSEELPHLALPLETSPRPKPRP